MRGIVFLGQSYWGVRQSRQGNDGAMRFNTSGFVRVLEILKNAWILVEYLPGLESR